MFEALIEWLTPTRVENIVLAIVGAVIGTFGGAYAGARAADRIATRKAQRAELLARVMECNAALSLCAAVCNRALNYKRQFAREMHGQFMLVRAAVGAHFAAVQAGAAHGPMPVDMNFRTMEQMQAPVVKLETVVLERIGLRGRPMQLAITLAECLPSLNLSVAERDRLIVEWRTSNRPDAEKVPLIYGFPIGGEHDTRMLDAVEGIKKKTDDCIWFSRTLHDDLVAHAKKLRIEYGKKWSGALPALDRAYLHGAEEDGLFPDNDPYEDWCTSFVKSPPRTKGRWLRRVGYVALRDARSVGRPLGLRSYINPSKWQLL